MHLVMKKKYFLICLLVLILSCFSAKGVLDTNQKKPAILIIEAHPGDWEDGIGGTIWMMKDKFDIHIVTASRGEMGGDVSEPSRELGEKRESESRKTGAMVGAENYFLGQIDMNVYADKYACDSLTRIIKLVDPDIVFTMWGIDVPDHSATFQMAIKALYETGHLHSAEVYFYESDMGHQTNMFNPKIYVDISSVIDKKLELLRCHETENPDGLLETNTLLKGKFHGYLARCEYAEGFKTYYPLINSRWGRSMNHSLLEIMPKKED